jgi:succinate dehydrogenase/fumarate reductase flavoprotein subunit
MEAILEPDSEVEVPCLWVGDSEPLDHSDDAQAHRDAGAAEATEDFVKLRAQMQRAMTEGAGVSRSAESLAGAEKVVRDIERRVASSTTVRPGAELANLCCISRALLRAAEMRCETRGAHSRLEYRETRQEWRRRIVHGRLADSTQS